MRIGFKLAEEGLGLGAAGGLLDPAHAHAHVPALEDHPNGRGPRLPLHRLGDLPGQPLLHLEKRARGWGWNGRENWVGGRR